MIYFGTRTTVDHKRECGFRHELDLMTLVCTRSRDFLLARLAERLRCPRCGCRSVAVVFSPRTGRIDVISSAAQRFCGSLKPG